jgi:two-component system, cell cycle response regulator DivK
MKILYVEDNENSAYMLQQRLKRRGYEVVLAKDGREGVARAQEEQPDLIVMDLAMPVLDGCDATRQLRNLPVTASIPIIALSAHAMPVDREMAVAAGCDDFDTKPVNFSRLLAKIEALLTSGPSS